MEPVADAVRSAVTGTEWRTHEFAELLPAQRPAPGLGWKCYWAAGDSGTSEAAGKLSLFPLLGSAAQFEVRTAQRAEPASSWEKGSYWALWFALEPKRKLKSTWAPSRGLTVSVFLFGSTFHYKCFHISWMQFFISKTIERWTIWLHKGVEIKILKLKTWVSRRVRIKPMRTYSEEFKLVPMIHWEVFQLYEIKWWLCLNQTCLSKEKPSLQLWIQEGRQ